MELGYGYSVISAIQTQLDNCIKTYTMAGATPTEISRLSGVTLAIQTQLNSTIKRTDMSTLGSAMVLSGTYTLYFRSTDTTER